MLKLNRWRWEMETSGIPWRPKMRLPSHILSVLLYTEIHLQSILICTEKILHQLEHDEVGIHQIILSYFRIIIGEYI